jgi:hypothetical protein
MPPPNPPRNLQGQLVNGKGQPIDGHGRRLDNFGRPTTERIIEPTEDLELTGFPNVIIAYPSLGDWTAMFDPRNNRGDRANRLSYDDFKRRHQKQMMTMLKEIASRAAGNALLSETNETGHTIMILPIDFVPTASKWVKYHTNAIASADSAIRSTLPGMAAGTRKSGNIAKGTGTGSDSEIYFSPERLRPGGPGFNPDEILFHEMVHAVRDTQGASTSGYKLGEGYDNAEEFAAVVTTNVYMSEKKQTALRADHGRGTLQQPEKFLDSPQVPAPGARGLLSMFRLRQPRLFASLAAIDRGTAAFNPFRQLAEETIKANAAHEAKMRAFDRRP